jgi:hypothetical protein
MTLDEPTRSTPALGQVDRLLKQSLLETQSLQVVRHMLMRDTLERAQQAGSTKFLAAVSMRQELNGHTAEAPAPKPRKKKSGRRSKADRIEDIRQYLSTHPGASTAELGAAIGTGANRVLQIARAVATPQRGPGNGKEARWFLRKQDATVKVNTLTKVKTVNGSGRKTLDGEPRQHKSSWYEKPALSGKPLTLFLLEHLMENTGQSAMKLIEEMASAGSPVKSPRYLNAPLAGSLASNGYAKKLKDGTYVRTAKGMNRAKELRGMLEAKGTVQAGGYGL